MPQLERTQSLQQADPLAHYCMWEEKYGVRFPGSHCLRRGSIRYVKETRGLEASIKFAAHSKPKQNSSTTENYYLPGNEDRAAKSSRAKARAELGAAIRRQPKLIRDNSLSASPSSVGSPFSIVSPLKRHHRLSTKVAQSTAAKKSVRSNHVVRAGKK